MNGIPDHLLRYTVKQDYSLYTNEDQAIWRFSMRQLFHYLKDHAHPSYVEGLQKTGISVDSIPVIAEMDKKLSAFGWRAVPVSGFIPPAAFMSFQAHRILPIASEIRSLENILYTPAPDIIHEAAGHAPILIDKDFTSYLGAYADVAQRAVISSEDIALYEAIRDLSDLKEGAHSTPESIKMAEDHLEKTTGSMTYVSEAQLLGRMNWWTAEYGLIGDLSNPKLFGAGLLSSISEARSALTKPKHIEFNMGCLDFTYDITEQQPQLFVAKDFKSLTSALKELGQSMAYAQGGQGGIFKAKQAKSVCTVELENKNTYSGVVEDYSLDSDGKITVLKMKAPCLLNNSELINKNSTYTFNVPLAITSTYGGPSSFEKYPEFEDFIAKTVTKNPIKNARTEELFKKIKDFRSSGKQAKQEFEKLKDFYFTHSREHWLAGLELFELNQDADLKRHLIKMQESSLEKDISSCISLGINLLTSTH